MASDGALCAHAARFAPVVALDAIEWRGSGVLVDCRDVGRWRCRLWRCRFSRLGFSGLPSAAMLPRPHSQLNSPMCVCQGGFLCVTTCRIGCAPSNWGARH